MRNNIDTIHSVFFRRSGVRYGGLVTAVVVALAGCGGKPAEEGASQVVARVNDKEITVHQVDYRLQRLKSEQPLDAAASAQQRAAVITDLVAEHVVVDKALADKLDRDPQVLLALQTARDEVLVRSYMEKVVNRVPPPTDAAIAKFYAEHAELFAKRKIYQGEQIILDKTTSATEVSARFAQGKSPLEAVAWLKEKSPNLKATPFLEPAEKLSMEVLPKLATMLPGQTAVITTHGNALLIHLVNTKDQPITLEQAKVWIARFLLNQDRKNTVDKELSNLKTLAHVELVGEAKKAATTLTTPVTPSKAVEVTTQQNAIEKGLAGLK